MISIVMGAGSQLSVLRREEVGSPVRSPEFSVEFVLSHRKVAMAW